MCIMASAGGVRPHESKPLRRDRAMSEKRNEDKEIEFVDALVNIGLISFVAGTQFAPRK